MARFRKSSYTQNEFFDDKHRYEHWYRDNTCYFITSKVREGLHLFASEEAKAVFWDRFDFYTQKYGFVPWIATLLDNHYHFEGYLKVPLRRLPESRREPRALHAAPARLCRETRQRSAPSASPPVLAPSREYFDGCLRDVLQAVRAYRYTKLQAVRAGIVRDYRDYPHTRVYLDIDRACGRAVELDAFPEDLPYARYERHRSGHRRM